MLISTSTCISYVDIDVNIHFPSGVAVVAVLERTYQGLPLCQSFMSGMSSQDLALELALKCLSFDFLGTTPDESADDLGSVQVPMQFWSMEFEEVSHAANASSGSSVQHSSRQQEEVVG
jgi:hypothetical protein